MKKYLLLIICCFSACHLTYAQLSFHANNKNISDLPTGISFKLAELSLNNSALPNWISKKHEDEWRKAEPKKLLLQKLSTAIWLKIPIDSIAKYANFDYLQIANPHINFIKCWVVKDDSIIQQYALTGDNTAFHTRTIDHTDFVFNVSSERYAGSEIIIAIDKRFTSLEIPLYFLNSSAFADFNQKENLIFGLILGLGLFFILIHLLLFFYTWDKVYLWYSLFQLCIFSFICIEHGYLFEYLYPSYQAINDVIRPVSIITSIAPLFLFFNQILQLAKYHPRLFKINNWLVTLYVSLLFISVLHALQGNFQVKGFWLSVGQIISPAMNLFLLSQAIYCSYKNIYYSKFLLLSILGNNFFIILFILAQNQILPSFFIFVNGIYISFIWELTIMTFVLVSRYSRYKKETDLLDFKIRQQQENVYKIIVDNQEKEMQRISSLLHDSVGASLGLLRLDIDHMPLTEEGRNLVSGKITTIGNDIRKLSHSLSPILLQEKGLMISIEDWIKQINQSGGINIQYEWIGNTITRTEKYEVIAFRIVQEMIHNIIKHSDASHAFLQIMVAEDLISIYAEDNGNGVDLNENNKGMGIKNIEKMMEILGGSCTIESAPGKGYNISVEFNYTIHETL